MERLRLVAIYIPYLLMPLALLWRAVSRPDGMFAPSPASAGKVTATAYGRSAGQWGVDKQL